MGSCGEGLLLTGTLRLLVLSGGCISAGFGSIVCVLRLRIFLVDLVTRQAYYFRAAFCVLHGGTVFRMDLRLGRRIYLPNPLDCRKQLHVVHRLQRRIV